MINRFSIDGDCPNCKTPFNDSDSYLVNGKEYPVRSNYNQGGDSLGDYNDWDELHFCENCKTEFSIENGTY